MENERQGFAPYWLTWALRDDKESGRIVDEFVAKIPSHFVSRLFVINRHTKKEYQAGDRYMIAYTYLASIWSITDLRFSIVCGYKDNGRQDVDTSLLDRAAPTPGFLRIQALGEEAWNKEEEKRKSSLLHSTSFQPEPEGRWVWVEE
jgi:hypothetical protein